MRDPASTSRPKLPAGEIHLWRIPLDLSEHTIWHCYKSLPHSEQARADDYRSASRRNDFVVTRSALRSILAAYMDNADPAGLAIGSSSHGKPRLDSTDERWLEFSIAHSGSLALVAVTRSRRIGVDVEAVSPIRNLERLAKTVLSAGELAGYAALPEEKRLRRLLQLWTLKEAYLKGLGVGLSEPLQQVGVTVRPDRTVELTTTGDTESAPWSLQVIDLGSDFATAIAVECESPTRIRLFDLSQLGQTP